MEDPIPAMRGALGLVVAGGEAAATAAAFEWVLVLAAAGAEARLILPAASAAAAFELIAGLAVAGVLGVAFGRRGRDDASVAGLAIGITWASCALFALANDAVPAVSGRSTPAWTAAAALALGLPMGFGVSRWLGSSRLSRATLFVEPILVAGPFYAAMFVRRMARIEPASPKDLAVSTAGLIAGVMLLAVTRRLPARNSFAIPTRALAIASLGAAAVIWAVALAAPAPFPAAPARPPGAPDVLLVVLDTVRADAVPADARASSPTPALARLAREGVRFEEAFSTSCWTLPAHASLFTGLLPREHGTGWESPYLPPEPATLAEVFSEAGYRTAGFSANVWISSEFGFDRGFDRFTAVSPSERPLVPWPLRVVPALAARLDAASPFDDKGGLALASGALRFLGAADPRPAFVFLNLLEAHMPYAPPERFLRQLAGSGFTRDQLLRIRYGPLQGLVPGSEPTPRDLEGLRLLYRTEVAYDDHVLGGVLDHLREAGRLDRTIVVVVGDHGESLGDHPPLDHQLGLWDALVRVPLLVRFPPRMPPGDPVSHLVSLTDVFPALIELAGLRAEPRGGPIVDATRREAVFMAYDRPGEVLDKIRHDLGIDPMPWDRRLDAVRTRDAKWIVGSDGSRTAFDLAHDPGERNNLAASGAGPPPGFAALEVLLRDAVAASSQGAVKEAKPISDETRRKLRSLGYVH